MRRRGGHVRGNGGRRIAGQVYPTLMSSRLNIITLLALRVHHHESQRSPALKCFTIRFFLKVEAQVEPG